MTVAVSSEIGFSQCPVHMMNFPAILLLSSLVQIVASTSFNCYDTAFESHIVLPSCGSVSTQYLSDLNSLVHTCNLVASTGISDLDATVFTCGDVVVSSEESFAALQSVNTSTTGRDKARQAIRNVVVAYLMNSSAAQSIDVVLGGYTVTDSGECALVAQALTEALASATAGLFAACTRTTATTTVTTTPTTTVTSSATTSGTTSLTTTPTSTQTTTLLAGHLQCNSQNVLFIDVVNSNCSRHAFLLNEIYFRCTQVQSQLGCTAEGFLMVTPASSPRYKFATNDMLFLI